MTDLRLYIRKVADELIDSFYAEREIDFLSRYASQLPACLIGHILGMPPEYPFFHRARVLNDPSL
jgi:cytochrome P450